MSTILIKDQFSEARYLEKKSYLARITGVGNFYGKKLQIICMQMTVAVNPTEVRALEEKRVELEGIVCAIAAHTSAMIRSTSNWKKLRACTMESFLNFNKIEEFRGNEIVLN